jgi:hypothetical protein
LIPLSTLEYSEEILIVTGIDESAFSFPAIISLNLVSEDPFRIFILVCVHDGLPDAEPPIIVGLSFV